MGQDLPATEARRTDALKRPDASNASLALLHKAQELAGRVESWADFADALFDAEHGFVAQVFPRLSERQAFFKTDTSTSFKL
jgi:hypothetical protein